MGASDAPDGEEPSDDVGRRGFRVKKILEDFQESLSSIEKCPKTGNRVYSYWWWVRFNYCL